MGWEARAYGVEMTGQVFSRETRDTSFGKGSGRCTTKAPQGDATRQAGVRA